MNSSITIVTAFFDIGRSNWTVDKGFQSYHHRTTETYFDYFRNLSKLDNQMIIFTSLDLKEKVEQIREGKPTTVITIDFEKKFKFIIRKIRAIQSSESFKQNIPQHQLIQPEYTSAEYVLVNNLKPYFVTQAIKLNLAKNDLVAWVDFGYCRSIKTTNGIKEWQYNFKKNVLHCFTINNKFKKESKNDTVKKVLNGDVFIIDGVLVGSKYSWLIFYKLITKLYRCSINNNFVDDDQYFMVMCYYKKPELIQLNYLGKNKWFDLFKKYSHNKSAIFFSKIIALSKNKLTKSKCPKDIEINKLPSLFSQTSKLATFIKLAHKQPLRLFYFCFLPKKIRQNLNTKACLAQKKIIAKNADTFIQYYIDGKLTKFNLLPKKNLEGKKIIWQYWGQGLDNNIIPETVNICFNSVDKYKNDYEVIRLDDKNISDYLDIPNFVWRKRKNQMFKHAFFSDLLRLALLDAYGGIWIDATILLTDTIPKDITEIDFFIFQRSVECKQKKLFQNLNAEYFQWGSEHFINILNSFIVSKPKNILTHTCLDLLLNYWQTQNDIKHYFFFQIIFNQLVTNPLYQQFNCPIFDDTYPHLLQMKLMSPFIESDYNDIKTKSTIHKITYIHQYPKNSYYEHLKDEFFTQNINT